MRKSKNRARTMARAMALLLCLALTPIPSVGVFAAAPASVTFDWGDSSTDDVVPADADGNVPVPAIKANADDAAAVFAGWYKTDPDVGNAARGDAPVMSGGNFTGITADVTYYARWIKSDDVKYVTTTDGAKEVTLGYSGYSGVGFIDANGAEVSDPVAYAQAGTGPIFKDLNRNGELDVYEDWRNTTEDRATNLAGLLKVDPDGVKQIAGLMLYSGHQRTWETDAPTQAQVTFFVNDDLRHVLVAGSAAGDKMDIHAKWNNNIQSIVEGLGFGIPANNSSDPRHGTSGSSNVEYYSANSGVSAWPSSLGMAATFDPDITLNFGKIASTEYRAMGIATALSPQIDIATDPRWSRFSGTFGEDPKLASAMSKAYVDGFQTTYQDGPTGNTPVTGGWGKNSVNAMMKHWPGGGAGEGGRDAHYNYGKYAVYPGGNWAANLIPFVDGSLSLEGGTDMASAVMPYYTISYMQVPGSEPNSSGGDAAKLNMANAYSEYMINGVLRDSYEYAGVVCTDWNVIGPKLTSGGGFDPDIAGMIWGVDDHYPEAEDINLDDMAVRAKMLLSAGVDQFGGLNFVSPIVTAYENNDLTPAEDKAALLDQLEQSAVRLLKNIFNTGLFENPYLNAEESKVTIGGVDFKKAGYEAQLKSTVLLKNKGNILPLTKAENRIYAPGASAEAVTLLKSYFGADNVSSTDSAGKTAAVVFMSSVSSGGGSRGANAQTGLYGNSYTPINLDYKDYTAVNARAASIAGEPIVEGGEVTGMENRSYKGVTTAPASSAAGQLANLKLAEDSDLPVIVLLAVSNPSVLEDVEPSADAILVNFGSQNAAVFDVMTGSTQYGDSGAEHVSVKPTAMLPMQFPLNMNEVETQYEDMPRDMACYVDADGNTYDFGFGLTYAGDGTTQIDASVNPGYTAYVAENSTPMTVPVNTGNDDSVYNIRNRRQVTFDYNYKESTGDKDNKKLIKVVNSGDTVVFPADPTRVGQTFYGWYTGRTGGVLANPGTAISADVTYYALWNAPVTAPPIGGGSGGGSGGTTPPAATPTPAATPVPTVTPVPTPTAGTENDEPGTVAQNVIEDIGLPEDGEAIENADGSVTLTEGGTVTLSNGSEITVPAGTKVNAGGNIIVIPRGSASAQIRFGDQVFNVEPGMSMEITDDGVALGGVNVFWDNPFDDVSDIDWFIDNVSYVYRTGLMEGTSAEPMMFSPNVSTTRGMIVTVLYRFEGSPDTTAMGNPFSDVPEGQWYHDAVKWASSEGIVLGYEDETFRPDRIVTREELATIIRRFMEYKEWNYPETRQIVFFEDEADIADYAKAAVQTLYKFDIINGVSEGVIAPKGEATRAQFAAMLDRLLLLVTGD